MHLWKDHQVDTDLLSCDKCDFRSESILKMEMHQEIHSADRSHVCPICKKVRTIITKGKGGLSLWVITAINWCPTKFE